MVDETGNATEEVLYTGDGFPVFIKALVAVSEPEISIAIAPSGSEAWTVKLAV